MRNCCQAIDAHFERRKVAGKLQQLELHGPPAETRLLLAALTQAGVRGLTVLDIGAGAGLVADQLLKAGATHATLVDISAAYLEAARRRLAASGFADRSALHQGDLTALGAALASADVVTLDKVICCYPDMNALVRESALKARRFYAASYPRERRLLRLLFWIENTVRRLRGDAFRTFVHSTRKIESQLKQAGFVLQAVRQTFAWRIVLFERPAAPRSGE
jgi:magnesium-protoporphyrin O-methyltransferase